MPMSLRFEIFTDDLDAVVDFYVRVLSFRLVTDQREQRERYVALERDAVRVGAAWRVGSSPEHRRPPTGVELVLEVDDVVAERERVLAAGWPIEEDLTARPWGLTDLRVLDPVGHYLRLTDRGRGAS